LDPRALYRWGYRDGVDDGFYNGRCELLKMLIVERFGDLSAELDHRLGAMGAELDSFAKRLITAKSLEHLFEGCPSWWATRHQHMREDALRIDAVERDFEPGFDREMARRNALELLAAVERES
jgi:hypothetical protein